MQWQMKVMKRAAPHHRKQWITMQMTPPPTSQSHAFATPLAELFAFVEQGHLPCSFIPQKHLELHANLQFWQYGLLAFVFFCTGKGAMCAKRHKSPR